VIDVVKAVAGDLMNKAGDSLGFARAVTRGSTYVTAFPQGLADIKSCIPPCPCLSESGASRAWPHTSPPTWNGRRWPWLLVLIMLFGLAARVGWVLRGLQAKQELDGARGGVARIRAALLDGDQERARQELIDVRQKTTEARDLTPDRVWRLASRVRWELLLISDGASWPRVKVSRRCAYVRPDPCPRRIGGIASRLG